MTKPRIYDIIYTNNLKYFLLEEYIMLKFAQLFADYLKEKDFNFETYTFEDGDCLVEFPYKGKATKLIFSGEDGKYLSLYLNFENVPEDKYVDVLIACNELNKQYKWATFYVDKDNDLVIHDDAILSVESAAEEAFELLVRIVRIAEDERQRIMKTIFA